MYDHTLELTHEVEAEVREFFGEIVYQTVVPRDVAVAESRVTANQCSTTPPDARAERTSSFAWRYLNVSKEKRLGRGLEALLGRLSGVGEPLHSGRIAVARFVCTSRAAPEEASPAKPGAPAVVPYSTNPAPQVQSLVEPPHPQPTEPAPDALAEPPSPDSRRAEADCSTECACYRSSRLPGCRGGRHTECAYYINSRLPSPIARLIAPPAYRPDRRQPVPAAVAISTRRDSRSLAKAWPSMASCSRSSSAARASVIRWWSVNVEAPGSRFRAGWTTCQSRSFLGRRPADSRVGYRREFAPQGP